MRLDGAAADVEPCPADEVDRLSITLCPTVAGGGAPLFTDGLPTSDWSLVDVTTADSGAICLLYDRVRSS